MSLKDKVAIVTGGNSGIGRAIALELANQGANIVIDYIAHPEATEELEQQIIALGDQATGVQADVSQVSDLQRLIETAVSKLGRVDIMVNNAGIETRTSVVDTTEAQYDKVLDVNLKSAFFGTQLAAKQMIKQEAVVGLSISLRSTKTGLCPATRPIASRRRHAHASPEPQELNSLRITSLSWGSAPAQLRLRSTYPP